MARQFVSARGLVALGFMGIIGWYRGFVPYWDARNYFNCVTEAIEVQWHLFNFRCAGHVSIAYFFVMRLTQFVVPWNVTLVYAFNALCGAASILAFDKLLRVMYPHQRPLDYALATLLYGFAPLWMAHAIFLNTDYGVTAFYVLFLCCLLTGRLWMATFWAVIMMFTKEIGAAAFVLTVTALLATCLMRSSAARRDWRRLLLRHAPLLVAPGVVVVYVVAYRAYFSEFDIGWMAAYLPPLSVSQADAVLTISLLEPGMRSFLADLFVLNFQWLLATVMALAIGKLVLRFGKDRVTGAEQGWGFFLSVVFFGLVVAVTRFRPVNNARYVLIAFPILVLTFFQALLFVFRNPVVRRSLLMGTAVLVVSSNFRTIDPFSKLTFGTFRFGTHAMLDMPSIMGGPRLDSLVYNLEALQFHYLISDAMGDLRPAPGSVVFMGNVTYNFPPMIDDRSYAPTLDRGHVLPIVLLFNDGDERPDVLRTHLASASSKFFYLAFAHADDRLLQRLVRLYPLVGLKRYSRSGYSLDVYSFQLKADGSG